MATCVRARCSKMEVRNINQNITDPFCVEPFHLHSPTTEPANSQQQILHILAEEVFQLVLVWQIPVPRPEVHAWNYERT